MSLQWTGPFPPNELTLSSPYAARVPRQGTISVSEAAAAALLASDESWWQEIPAGECSAICLATPSACLA